MRFLTFLEAIDDDNKLGGGAGVLIYVPSTGRMLIQQRGEHPDDKDSGKYDFFGGTLEEGETAEECARREAKEEGQIEFPEDSLTEIGAFSSTEGGDWDGEPYHVFMFSATNEFRPKIQAEEVAKAGWIDPTKLNDQNSTNRIVKALAHEKVRNLLRVDQEESAPENPTHAGRPQNNRTEAQHNKLISAQQDKLISAQQNKLTEAAFPYQEYQVSGEWYHGMASSSRAFVRRKGSHPSNIGIWLTNDKNIASQFAQQASKRMVDDEPVLVTAQVRTESPMVYDTYKDYLEAWKEYSDSDKMRRALMRQGHDFIIIAQSDTDFGGEHRMDIAVFKTTDLRVLDKEKLK